MFEKEKTSRVTNLHSLTEACVLKKFVYIFCIGRNTQRVEFSFNTLSIMNGCDSASRKKVGYVFNDPLIKAADKLPSNIGRASRVHKLIEAFGLLSKLDIITPVPLERDQLILYHDENFIDYLQRAENSDPNEIYEDDDDDGNDSSSSSGDEKEPQISFREQFGLEFDSYVFDGLWDYVKRVSGATVACAEYLIQQKGTIAINWTGGRHHCRKARASGFCYINDVILGVIKLRAKFPRVMYIDIDLHHGDGVEAGFSSSPNVFTVSVHRFGKGFYPGTGKSSDRGIGKGIGYTKNIPTYRGLSDETLLKIFTEQIEPEKSQNFQPDAIVVVCGTDGLSRDTHLEWNLTSKGISTVIQKILNWNLPTMLLGGGGYHHHDTARTWSMITSQSTTGSIPEWTDIPDHEYLSEYVSDAYQFDIPSKDTMKDENI